MLEVNKYMTWDEIVKEYPNKWTVITDVKLDKHDNILSGLLMFVCSDANLGEALGYALEKTNNEKMIYTERTTRVDNELFFNKEIKYEDNK